MNRFWITDPIVFYGIGAALVLYVLYTMIVPRKGERPGQAGREPEL